MAFSFLSWDLRLADTVTVTTRSYSQIEDIATVLWYIIFNMKKNKLHYCVLQNKPAIKNCSCVLRIFREHVRKVKGKDISNNL